MGGSMGGRMGGWNGGRSQQLTGRYCTNGGRVQKTSVECQQDMCTDSYADSNRDRQETETEENKEWQMGRYRAIGAGRDRETETKAVVWMELTVAMQRHVQMRQPSVRPFVRASVDRSTRRINSVDLIRKVDFQISRRIRLPPPLDVSRCSPSGLGTKDVSCHFG